MYGSEKVNDFFHFVKTFLLVNHADALFPLQISKLSNYFWKEKQKYWFAVYHGIWHGI